MSVKLSKVLTLCSVLWGLSISPALARQTTSYYDLTTPTSPHSTEQHTYPTPTANSTTPKFSSNDPFRIFAPPSDPICCLVLLPPAQPDPHPTDDLLPFEEWKERQLALTSAEARKADELSASAATVAHVSDESAPLSDTNILIPLIETTDSPAIRPVADFVPIEGRFNYASLDCSARVHTSHKSMKSAHSILSSKKDKYMLAPCSAESE